MRGRDLVKYSRGARVFRRMQRRLLPRYKGQIVAIEPDSGRYFIGKDELQAARRAMAAFPGKMFDFFRIGFPAVHKFRSTRPGAERIR